jgi:hypothetical protein
MPAGYYVSMTASPRRTSLLLGPFPVRGAAHLQIAVVRDWVVEHKPHLAFAAFSVARVFGRTVDMLPAGRLNTVLPHLLPGASPP